MKFLVNPSENKYKRNRSMTFFIACLKLFSSLLCEIILIIMITHYEDIGEMIKEFVALGFITKLDN